MNARAVVFALLLAGAAPAFAGRSCEEKPLPAAALERGLALAQATARALDDSGAEVVVLARAGQDLGRWGLRWSHLAFAYREGQGERSVWRVVHKLNQCGTPRADLYRQGLGQFFLDQPHRYEAAWQPLSPEAQQRLLPLLRDDASLARLHEPQYNLVAYPWAQRYQQSNQWAIETLATALDAQVRDRADAQRWLRGHEYQPTPLQIDAMTRLGASVTRANVAFDDHPFGQRMAGRIETVTVDSVFRWLAVSGLAGPVRTVGL